MKTSVLIGSVGSSQIFLEELISVGYPPALVFSLDESVAGNVSGYVPLHEIAQKHDVPYIKFKKINDKNNIEKIANLKPNFIFVIGISQLISSKIINAAKDYCVGLHPAPLPKYRGRAAVVWQMLLGESESALTIFKLGEGMDDGDIIEQVPYQILPADYAIDVHQRIRAATQQAARSSIPKIFSGKALFRKQDESKASYLLIRRPEDGKINWNNSVSEIFNLIRATSHPYPGAFTYYKGEKIIESKAKVLERSPYIGFNGQIAYLNENGLPGVVVGEKLLELSEIEFAGQSQSFRVGHRFD